MRPHAVPMAVLVVASLAISDAEARYEQINSYLCSMVDNDDVSANMAFASQWLEEQEGTRQSFFSRTPISDLKKFTALQEVIDDSSCGRRALVIMRQNEEAVRLHRLIENRQVHRRIDRIIMRIFKDHAEKCSSLYPQMYRKKRHQLNAVLLEQVENIARAIMGADRFLLSTEEVLSFYEPSELFQRYIQYYPRVGHFAKNNLLHSALVANAKADLDFKYTHAVLDEPTGKVVVHKDKLKGLARKYLIEPCQHYVDKLGFDLFIPARFDMQVYFNINDQDGDYFLGWSYYMICLALTRDERTVYDDVIKYVMG